MSDPISSSEWRLPVPLDDEKRDWQARNLARIQRHIKGLSQQPDDTLFSGIWDGHFVVVTKNDGFVRLWLIDQEKARTQWSQSGLELARPLRPTYGYLRGMVFALLWQPNPTGLFFGGLGGGILPTLMHHYLPDATIDCVEIAPPVIAAARGFFPLPQDERMRIWTRDALVFLRKDAGFGPESIKITESTGPQDTPDPEPLPRYDILFLDIFLDQGSTPAHLTDSAFFEACRERLGPGGVLGLNLHAKPDDPRRELLTSLFPTVVDIPMKKNHSLLLATDRPQLSKFEMMERLRLIYQHYQFDFSVNKWIDKLTYL